MTTTKRTLSLLGSAAFTLFATSGLAQTELDDLNTDINLQLTADEDTQTESAGLISHVDTSTHTTVSVCRRMKLIHSNSTNKEPTSTLDIAGGEASFDIAAPVGETAGGYTIDMFYAKCTGSLSLSSLGIGVPTTISVDIAGIPSSDRPSFIVLITTNSGSGAVTHTSQKTPTTSGSSALSFAGADFSPALPTSPSSVMMYLDLRIVGSVPTQTQAFSWSNFQYE